MHYAQTIGYLYGMKWIKWVWISTSHYIQWLIFMHQTPKVKAIIKFLEENIGGTSLWLRDREDFSEDRLKI